jgi:AAA family ATP:ADP antiporter
MIIFAKLANTLSRESLFKSIISSFLIFFGVFAWIIYPNKELLHFSAETVKSLQTSIPALHWFIPVIGNWSFSLFYILSELWGSVVLSMLFWQFANEITKVIEAKRFYGLFGMIGNFGLVISGSLILLCSTYAKGLEGTGIDAWGLNIKIQMTLVVGAGLITIFIYNWMQKNVLTDPRFYESGQESGGKKKKPKLSLSESFKYLLTSPYLLLIAVIVLAYGVSINLVEGVWKSQIKIRFPNENDYQAFMGQFSVSTGIVTMILMVVGNNILRRLSWLKAAIITPLMILVTSAIFFGVIIYSNSVGNPNYEVMLPLAGTTTLVMLVVIIGQIQNVLSKATKYSLFDSTKQMAYIPLDQELKVKGQAAVEVIGGRAGKSGGAAVTSTLLMFAGGSATLSSLVYVLGPIVIGIVVIWCFSVTGLSKKFTALTQEKAKEQAAV